MASSALNPECLMCLDSQATVKFASCKHSYCTKCLTRHIMASEMFGRGVTTIACPICMKEATTGHENVVGSKLDVADAETPIGERAMKRQDSCQVCCFNGKDVKSSYTCEECFDMLLCKDCRKDHGENKATENHVVVSIAKQARHEAYCELHAELLRSFCCTCSAPVCRVCVSLLHGNHTVRSLGEEYRHGITEVKHMIEEEERRLLELRDDAIKLKDCKTKAVEMEYTLIKDIEDKAEECVELILKKKEEMEKQVKIHFGVTNKLSKQLDAMPGLITNVEEAINEAQLLLEVVELHPKCVDKMNKVKQRFAALKQPDYETMRESYREEFTDVQEANLSFTPACIGMEFGVVSI